MIKFKYQYTEKHLEYMRYQIHEMKERPEVYDDLSEHEFSQFRDYIGQPKIVFEAGCGLGRGSIYMNHLLADSEIEYILADRNGFSRNSGGYEDGAYYNELDLTESFSKLNGIERLRTFETEEHDWSSLPKVDLIFSLCSFGMHVSIAKYMDRLLSISKPTTTMIFGVRQNHYNENSFKELFEEVIFIPSKKIFVPELKAGELTGKEVLLYPEENWLILKNPR